MLSLDKIKQLRITLGLSQDAVAKCYEKEDGKMGCSRNHIIMLEHGNTKLTPEIYKRWINAIYLAEKKKKAKEKKNES